MKGSRQGRGLLAQVSSASTSYAIGIVIYKTMFFYVKILWLDNIKIFIL